jgi:hypothetical protein
MRLQKCIDRTLAKAGVGKTQAWPNEICSDQGNDQKLFKRGENTVMTAMLNVSWQPIEIFSDHILPSPQVRLRNPRELVDVSYQASNLAHRGAKSRDRHPGGSLCFALSVIAVRFAS